MPIIALMDRTAGLIQYLGKAADAEAALQELRSGIDSDFPITISGKVTPQNLRGRVGQGGRDLSIETVNGSIRLRKRA